MINGGSVVMDESLNYCYPLACQLGKISQEGASHDNF
jgi:hypothetical protein